MPQIRSSAIRDLHCLMMLAHTENKADYEVWADTLHMTVYRRKNTIPLAHEEPIEWTHGQIDKNGKLLFNLLKFRPPEDAE